MNDACCKPGRDPLKISRGLLPFLGRLLISLIFILAGVMKIFLFPETVSAFEPGRWSVDAWQARS